MNSFIESLEELVSGRAFIPVYAINAYNNGFGDNDIATPYLLYLFVKNQAKKNAEM